MELRYLGTSQARLGGDNACPVASVYFSLYLLYSTAPRVESLVQYLKHACEDYLDCIRKGVHEGRFEHVTQPLSRHRFVRASMKLDDDLECSGLMLTPESLYDQLPADGPFANSAFQLLRGIRPALEKIAACVSKIDGEEGDLLAHEQPARAFAFSRAGATIAGSCRRLPGGALRWDFVDPHERVLTSFPPPKRESSAIWATCSTIAQAVGFLETVYPPSTSIESILGITEENTYEHLRPAPFYSLTVFKREFASKHIARRAYEEAMAKSNPIYVRRVTQQQY